MEVDHSSALASSWWPDSVDKSKNVLSFCDILYFMWPILLLKPLPDFISYADDIVTWYCQIPQNPALFPLFLAAWP